MLQPVGFLIFLIAGTAETNRPPFDLPEADMGCHPSDTPDASPSGTHYLSFYCDDIEQTVAELRGRGVEFRDGITDRGYGLATHFTMAGGVQVELSGVAAQPLVLFKLLRLDRAFGLN